MGLASFVIFKKEKAPPLLERCPQDKGMPHLEAVAFFSSLLILFQMLLLNIPAIGPLRKECGLDRWKQVSVMMQMQDYKFTVEEVGDNYLGGFCGLFQHLVF